ncbi:alpha/beta hydrolase [Geomicrobium sp. JCM 19055]|uniref:alpha/beta hydrolase n=1 Tax=Geomicrobium sp. JCM 19055 TaxID=1460649 RepID=UPI00045ECD07|nr:dienelactone hydrolase family protein [Geomicrobium sp. JCM 19055]GAJ98910.1 carboxylesterase [Geomicrobium sp. JCM 19055]
MKSFYHHSQTSQDVFIVLHGSGGRETDLLHVVGEIDDSLSVLGIRGDVSNNNKGFRYFNRPVDGQFDYAEIQENTDRIASFIKEQVGTGRSIHLVGYSNGANLAISLLLSHSDLFDSAILLHPSHLFSHVEAKSLDNVAVFITSGARDVITTPGDVMAVKKQLSDNGAQVTVKLTDYGHELTDEEIKQATSWWNTEVKA